jgi:hypothetical protein
VVIISLMKSCGHQLHQTHQQIRTHEFLLDSYLHLEIPLIAIFVSCSQNGRLVHGIHSKSIRIDKLECQIHFHNRSNKWQSYQSAACVRIFNERIQPLKIYLLRLTPATSRRILVVASALSKQRVALLHTAPLGHLQVPDEVYSIREDARVVLNTIEHSTVLKRIARKAQKNQS